MRVVLRFYCLVGLLCVLTGCSHSASLIADAALRDARETSDPILALLRLQAAQRIVLDTCHSLGLQTECDDALNQLYQAKDQWVDSVLSGNNQVIRTVFDTPELAQIQQQMLPKVIEMARLRNDPSLLYAVGKGLGGGIGEGNLNQQLSYFTAAWQAGDKPAAGELAKLLGSSGDTKGAMLWALRCTDTCVPKMGFRPEELSPLLRPDVVAKLRAAAADPSTLAAPAGL